MKSLNSGLWCIKLSLQYHPIKLMLNTRNLEDTGLHWPFTVSFILNLLAQSLFPEAINKIVGFANMYLTSSKYFKVRCTAWEVFTDHEIAVKPVRLCSLQLDWHMFFYFLFQFRPKRSPLLNSRILLTCLLTILLHQKSVQLLSCIFFCLLQFLTYFKAHSFST